MNGINLKPEDAEFALLDRLVDGELSEFQRRQLLASMDQRPEGWRRCALAFLEAQSWGSEFKLLSANSVRTAAAEKTAEFIQIPPANLSAANLLAVPAQTSEQQLTPAVSSAPTERATRPVGFRWSTFWATAASILLAFVGMLYLHGDLQFKSSGGGNSLVSHPQPGLNSGRGRTVAGGPQTITVAFPNQNGMLQTMQLPVVEGKSLDELMAGEQETGIPPQVLEYFRRSGQEVKQDRQIVPLQLQDGRRAFMPVNRVRVVPADRPFQ